MAENNSSAPLTTAEGAYPALPAPDTHCHDEDTGRDVWSFSAEQMHAYAAQAVAAQAAPAAVPVPDERESYIDWLSGSHPRVFSKTDAEAYWRNEHVSALAWQARAALAATPALPATEDSSVGDLAEVQAEPVAEARVSQDAAGKKTVELELRYGDLPSGTHLLFTAPQAQPADALDGWAEERRRLIDEAHENKYRARAFERDAARYRYIRDTPWANSPLGRVIAQHRNALWDTEIDAAMAAAQEGGKT